MKILTLRVTEYEGRQIDPDLDRQIKDFLNPRLRPAFFLSSHSAVCIYNLFASNPIAASEALKIKQSHQAPIRISQP